VVNGVVNGQSNGQSNGQVVFASRTAARDRRQLGGANLGRKFAPNLDATRLSSPQALRSNRYQDLESIGDRAATLRRARLSKSSPPTVLLRQGAQRSASRRYRVAERRRYPVAVPERRRAVYVAIDFADPKWFDGVRAPREILELLEDDHMRFVQMGYVHDRPDLGIVRREP
jgi:hypothetical protein